LRSDELKLYDLIWKRTVASQMVDARGETVSITLEATPLPQVPHSPFGPLNSLRQEQCSPSAVSCRPIKKVPTKTRSHDKAEKDDDPVLPAVTVGEALSITEVEAKAHTTQPPARYTEASLVKALEERGIGRPSTYASIISTIIDRGYVVRRGSALVPQWIAFPVTRLLHERFAELVDFDYTAGLEEDLDRIASGEYQRADPG
jgi:DNA topoisomerase I